MAGAPKQLFALSSLLERVRERPPILRDRRRRSRQDHRLTLTLSSGLERANIQFSLLAAVFLAAGLLAGCEDRSYRDIGAEINVLTTRTDALVPPAIRRLSAYKRRALPQIEIALHTASPAGKVNLVRAIEAIDDREGVAILRHFAVYDPEPSVRTTCEEVLKKWQATAALARIQELRAKGEGPVVLGSK
jgi:HEAT repeat protein